MIVIENATLEEAKTKALIGHFSGLGLTNALIVDGAEVHTGFAMAARNIRTSTCCRSRASTSMTFCAVTSWF